MTTNQSDKQADARASTGTALNYEGDFLAYFDQQGVPAGDFNGRLLTWINQVLGTSYTEINGAKAALATSAGFANWDSLNLLGSAQPVGQAFFTSTDSNGIDQFVTVTDNNGVEQRITVATGLS
jgi:hypothetical protein